MSDALEQFAKQMQAWCDRTQQSLNDAENRAALVGTYWIAKQPYADDVQPVVQIDEVGVNEPTGAWVRWSVVDQTDRRGSDWWVDFLYQFVEVEPIDR